MQSFNQFSIKSKLLEIYIQKVFKCLYFHIKQDI